MEVVVEPNAVIIFLFGVFFGCVIGFILAYILRE